MELVSEHAGLAEIDRRQLTGERMTKSEVGVQVRHHLRIYAGTITTRAAAGSTLRGQGEHGATSRPAKRDRICHEVLAVPG